MLPTPRDKAIILAVYTHGRLSREHIRRLFFRRSDSDRLSSIQATSARLRRLAEAGYLSRVPVPVLKGSGQYLYSLGETGARFLAAEYKIVATPRSARALGPSFLFLEWERGHQGLQAIAEKLDGYDAYYARRGYLEHLGEVGLTPRLAFV